MRYTITRSISINAPRERVWRVLTDPSHITRWNLGVVPDTTWQPQSPIVLRGTVGKMRIHDHGTIRRCEPPAILEYDILPRISGLPDSPENYSIIRFELTPSPAGDGTAATTLVVTHAVPPSPTRRGRAKGQDGGAPVEWAIGPESSARHVEFYWTGTLPIIKAIAEDTSRASMRQPS